jgi:hypothetical protein
MRIASIATAAALLALAGCATPAYKDVTAEKSVEVGNGVLVNPQIEWGQASVPGFRGTLWTVDGAGLDALMFFPGVPPGSALISPERSDKVDEHTYTMTMLPDDVMELTAANLEKLGYQQVHATALRPAPFGSVKGFRFDLSFTNADGLQMKGMALGCQRNGRLDLILFMAPTEYYFDHYAATVDRVFSSVQLSG